MWWTVPAEAVSTDLTASPVGAGSPQSQEHTQPLPITTGQLCEYTTWAYHSSLPGQISEHHLGERVPPLTLPPPSPPPAIPST
jgi:hypothetical protein